jgi:hypothetical protein
VPRHGPAPPLIRARPSSSIAATRPLPRRGQGPRSDGERRLSLSRRWSARRASCQTAPPCAGRKPASASSGLSLPDRIVKRKRRVVRPVGGERLLDDQRQQTGPEALASAPSPESERQDVANGITPGAPRPRRRNRDDAGRRGLVRPAVRERRRRGEFFARDVAMVRFLERYDDPERRDRDSRVGGLAVRRQHRDGALLWVAVALVLRNRAWPRAGSVVTSARRRRARRTARARRAPPRSAEAGCTWPRVRCGPVHPS